MSTRALALCAAMAGMYALAVNAADQPIGAAGHWEGTIHVAPPNGPAQDVPLVVDLDRTASGGWKGSIDLGPRVKGLELGDITVSGAAVHFAIRNMPGNPTFDAKLSPDGKTLSGDATQAGQTTTFTLNRAGLAKVAAPPKSTVISKELLGKWQGVLQPPGGQQFHLIVELTSASDGTGSGTLTSTDQGNSKIGLSQITQKGQNVTFIIQMINGSFDGQLNADGTELKGTWTQGPASLPLTFTKETAHATTP